MAPENILMGYCDLQAEKIPFENREFDYIIGAGNIDNTIYRQYLSTKGIMVQCK